LFIRVPTNINSISAYRRTSLKIHNKYKREIKAITIIYFIITHIELYLMIRIDIVKHKRLKRKELFRDGKALSCKLIKKVKLSL
jgi:hypothetical protein